MTPPNATADANATHAAVRKGYAAVAASTLDNNHEGVRRVAHAFGYTPDDLTHVPDGANMGLSCGNPTATANLKPGETVVDLGCGGGLDVFLAAAKVQPGGRAIGVDMTPEMIERARRNAASHPLRDSVAFHLATIDDLPLEDASADVVISNCVINLAPDKPAVFREMFRILKPGGRVAVSDIVLREELPRELADNAAALVGCISGALPADAFTQGLRDAGFTDVTLLDDAKDLNAYGEVAGQSACCSPAAPVRLGKPAQAASSCCGGSSATPWLHEDLGVLLTKYDVNRYAMSAKVYALKPL